MFRRSTDPNLSFFLKSTTNTDSEQIYKRGIFGIRGFQKAQLGSNEREFCGDGLESHKYRRSRWVLLVVIKTYIVSTTWVARYETT